MTQRRKQNQMCGVLTSNVLPNLSYSSLCIFDSVERQAETIACAILGSITVIQNPFIMRQLTGNASVSLD